MDIKILLADDHQIISEGLAQLIRNESNMNVVKSVTNGKDAVAAAIEYKPDIVLMDIGMPVLNGVEATRQIKDENPKIKIIGLSNNSSKKIIVEIIRSGASGYLAKDCLFEEIVTSIKTVLAGELYITPKVNALLINDLITSESKETAFSILSQREREILQLIVDGFHTKEIADKLHISDKTVHTHRKNIMDKTNSKGIADLVKYAIKEGLVSVE